MAVPASNRINVGIVEYYRLLRELLTGYIGGGLGCNTVVVGQWAEVAEIPVAAGNVHVVIISLSYPVDPWEEQLACLRDRVPRARRLLIGAGYDVPVVRSALQSGAAGYVSTDDDLRQLPAAVRSIFAGERYVSPNIAASLIAHDRSDDLSPREIEVLRHVADGASSHEIGGVIGVSSRTVDVHRANIMNKTGIRDIAGLTKYALQLGITGLPATLGRICR